MFLKIISMFGLTSCISEMSYEAKQKKKYDSCSSHTLHFGYQICAYMCNDVCINKSLKWKRKSGKQKQKQNFKIIFWPEHAENINYVYLINQIFESVSDVFSKQILESIGPTYGIVFVCISSCSVDKRLHIAVFVLIKWKIKKLRLCRVQQFSDMLLETYLFVCFFA